MNISKHIAFSALSVAMLFASCKNNSPYEGYDATDNGLYYKFYNEDRKDDGQKPAPGENIVISYKIKITDKDSLLLDSKDVSRDHSGNVEFPLVKSTFKGSFEEGIMMMSPGDSASFIVNADSFLLKTNKLEKLPPFIKPNSMLTIETKLISIKDSVAVKKEREKMMAEQQKQMEEMQKQVEERKGQEGPMIEEYLKTSKITAKPTKSGLYYVEKKKGTGPRVAMGDSAKVNYALFTLDGQMIESNTAMFSMNVQGMIPGFVEGITMMNKGGKATLVLPSELAYGAYGSQAIPPYTPLVFEVEVVDVKKR